MQNPQQLKRMRGKEREGKKEAEEAHAGWANGRSWFF
jgi:hypothetical protein